MDQKEDQKTVLKVGQNVDQKIVPNYPNKGEVENYDVANDVNNKGVNFYNVVYDIDVRKDQKDYKKDNA